VNKPRILVVDDEDHILLLLTHMLEQCDYDVVTATDGIEAYSAAVRVVPDLIVLDLMLPGMDGIDVCRRLRRNELFASTPILLVTARTDERSMLRGFEVGATDYVTKPFSLAVLRARVKAALHYRVGVRGVAHVSPADDAWLPGYRKVAEIARGSMGTVYRAVQTSLDREVAVKTLHRSLAEDPEYIRRFLVEARLAGSLSHPNVVGVIDAGESGGTYYIAMEFVEGSTVSRLLGESGRLEARRALLVAFQVALGLEHARRKGLIHRDVKPCNILVRDDGVAKLADLGLARSVIEQRLAGSPMDRVVGTPDYMSPEQITIENDIDARADVYALGATLFHMLTGRPPFADATTLDVLKRHLDAPRPLPSEHGAPVDANTDLVVTRAMAIDRGQRYHTPREFAADLKCLLQGKPPGWSSRSKPA